jgi:hypothetical protein
MEGEFWIGTIFGALAFWVIYRVLLQTYKLNFKRYLGELDSEHRVSVDAMLLGLYKDAEVLAEHTNSRLLKSLHNDLVELRALLQRKWMQS